MSDPGIAESETGELAEGKKISDTVKDEAASVISVTEPHVGDGTDSDGEGKGKEDGEGKGKDDADGDKNKSSTSVTNEIETELSLDDTDSTDSSLIKIKVPNYRGSPLCDLIDESHIDMLHKIFVTAPKQRLSEERFRGVLDSVVGIIFEDCDFKLMFKKMQYQNNGWIIWDDLVSYLIVSFNKKAMDAIQLNLDTPIDGPPRNIKSCHRYPVVRVIFCPALDADRKINYERGCYASIVTVGNINFFNLDLELVNSFISKSPFIKVTQTWATDFVCLPDFSTVCVSTTEFDLRFYDTTGRRFSLRFVVGSLSSSVVAMHYAWAAEASGVGHLVTGDTAGGVNVYSFPAGSHVFHNAYGNQHRIALAEQVLRGEVPGVTVKAFRAVHTNWVKQVYYNQSLSSVLSCSLGDESALVIRDGQGELHTFHVALGVECFAVQEDAHLMASGGPDCLVRLWNMFVSQKAVCVFRGHHSCVVALVIQGDTQRVVSLSKDRCIKVWDIAFQNCIQTYNRLPASIESRWPLTTFYNPLSRKLIVAGTHFSVISCGTLLPQELTDGHTHASEVTCIVYNPLFQVLVSVDCCSLIMIWDFWKGQRTSCISSAHTKFCFGKEIVVEITAVTFDPSFHFLLTGARDGTVKMWNFNNGTCVRNILIEPDKEVTSLIWLKDRIFATGWNRCVVELQGRVTPSPPKAWETRHKSEVLAAAARAPQCLATASYAGEIVLWRMETGQAFRRHIAADPTVASKMDFMPRTSIKPSGSVASSQRGVATHRSSASRRPMSLSMQVHAGLTRRFSASQLHTAASAAAASAAAAAGGQASMRQTAVYALHFLCSRLVHRRVGTLLVALENGLVQIWSHHSAGGFISAFQAVHSSGDYVICMTTDPGDSYLFTGTTLGYIKVWLMINYQDSEHVYVVMPMVRLQFPFMWADRIQGRAKRRVRMQPLPTLLSCHRGHLRGVNKLVFISPAHVLVSCSKDFTVRVWNLGGQYIGTLGSSRPWVPISPDDGPGKDHPYRVPADLRRVASYTTIRVLTGGRKWWESKRTLANRALMATTRNEFPKQILASCVHGSPLKSPRLGHNFRLPSRPSNIPPNPIIDTTESHIPVFCHLSLRPEAALRRPKTPPGVKERQLKQSIEIDVCSSVESCSSSSIISSRSSLGRELR